MKQSIIITALFVAACSPSVKVQTSWKNDEQVKKLQTAVYRNIFIVALTDNPSNRRMVEEDFAAVAAGQGYTPIKSTEALGTAFTSGKPAGTAELIQRAKEMKTDGILTIAIVHKDAETRHVGSAAYAPYPRFRWYNNFGDYYTQLSGTLYTSGYYASDKVYYFESNLFDAGTESIIWSAQSETYNPPDLASVSKKFAHAMINQLEKDGLLKR